MPADNTAKVSYIKCSTLSHSSKKKKHYLFQILLNKQFLLVSSISVMYNWRPLPQQCSMNRLLTVHSPSLVYHNLNKCGHYQVWSNHTIHTYYKPNRVLHGWQIRCCVLWITIKTVKIFMYLVVLQQSYIWRGWNVPKLNIF